MARQATVYRILIASPSDVVTERKIIPEVIYSWNAVNSSHYGVVLEPVLWETHARPEMGDRPQAIINKQVVEECDILIGAFWTRIGTHTGKAESGTVEEIEEFRKAGKNVMLYFSSIPVVPDSVDLDQYKKLTEFKKKCLEEGIVGTYESIGDLRDQLQRHISTTIEAIYRGKLGEHSKIEDAPQNDQKKILQMFKTQFETFLRRLEVEWNAERNSEPMGIEEGKYVLEKTYQEVLDFRAQIDSNGESNLTVLMDEALRRLKTIQRHELAIDGGMSYRAFWNEGNQIVELLKNITNEITSLIEKGKAPREKTEEITLNRERQKLKGLILDYLMTPQGVTAHPLIATENIIMHLTEKGETVTPEGVTSLLYEMLAEKTVTPMGGGYYQAKP